MAMRNGRCLLTPRKGPRLSRPSAWGDFSASPTRPTTGSRARSTSWKLTGFWLFRHHDSLSKTILQGTLGSERRRGRQKKCSKGEAGRTTPRSRHSCPYHNCLGPSHTTRPSVGFSSGASAAIQHSVAPPSERSLCRSAARCYLCRLASEMRDA